MIQAVEMSGRADDRLRDPFNDGAADGQGPSRVARPEAATVRRLTADERARLVPPYAVGIRRTAAIAEAPAR